MIAHHLFYVSRCWASNQNTVTDALCSIYSSIPQAHCSFKHPQSETLAQHVRMQFTTAILNTQFCKDSPRQPFVATSIPFGQHSIYIERDPVRGYQWASPSANKDKEIDRDKNKDTRRQTGPRHKHEQRAGSGEYRGWTSGLNTPRRAGRMGKQGASCLRAALSTRRGRVDRPSPGPAPFWPNASGSPEGAV